MSSSRLPGKVLADIGGQTMLARVVERTSRSTLVSEVIVATTTEPADDPLAAYCAAHAFQFTRGSQFDVLDRYYRTAVMSQAGVVVRITADCPLIDAHLIDMVAHVMLDGQDDQVPRRQGADGARFDFAANRLPPPWTRTYPIGLDAEACTFGALERAWTEAREPRQREHVMPYMYEDVHLTPVDAGLWVGTTPRGFRVALLQHPEDFGSYRWTVDTSEDLELARAIYSNFGNRSDFGWGEVLDLVHARPELMQINAGVRHKTLRDVDERASRNQ